MKCHTAEFLIFDFKKAKITIFGSKISFFGHCEKFSLTFFSFFFFKSEKVLDNLVWFSHSFLGSPKNFPQSWIWA